MSSKRKDKVAAVAMPRDRLERPLRDLRISVTDRCNFRCTYCMPAEIFGEKYEFLPKRDLLNFEEIVRLVRVFAELGVNKVRFSGGEPLLRHDLDSLIERIALIDGIDDLALTTNAVLLPRWAERLQKAGLQRVTISLDSLNDLVFREMNGQKSSVDQVLEGIDAAEKAGYTQIKINCVVQKGVNDHTLVALAEHFRHTGHILRFIEYMDVGTRNHWNLDHVLNYDEIVERIGARFPLEPIAPQYPGEVAKRLRYRDGAGEIGLVTSVSRPFCGACSRARLTTDGKIVTCLFASSGFDVRTPLREGVSHESLVALIKGIWQGRTDRYSEERGLPDKNQTGEAKKLEMYQLGG